MNIRNLIESSYSTRNFKDKPVPVEQVEETIEFVKNEAAELPYDIDIIYLEDGKAVKEKLKGIAGFHGIMIKAPQYFLFLFEEKENHEIYTGYLVQKCILKLTELGVNSCWITLPEMGSIVKEALGIDNSKEASALLAIGYDYDDKKVINKFKWGENYSKADIKIVENNVSTRLTMDEIVFLEKWGKTMSIDEFKQYALEDIFRYIVMAPSSFNRQPWRFILQGDKLHLAIRHDPDINGEQDLLDAGIIILYIELLFKSFNVAGKWELQVDSQADVLKNAPEEYRYIGYFKMEK